MGRYSTEWYHNRDIGFENLIQEQLPRTGDIIPNGIEQYFFGVEAI
jgi:hypothetical protein